MRGVTTRFNGTDPPSDPRFLASPLRSLHFRSLHFPDTASAAVGPAAAATAVLPSKYFQRNAEITDIDARLEALQQFLHTAQAAS